MNFVTIKPALAADGVTPLRVPMAANHGLPKGQPLPADGYQVPQTVFVQRLIQDGAVVVVQSGTTSGTVSSGAATSSGGSVSSGGTVSSGGAVSSGGTVSSAGTTSSGATVSSGGSVSSGGTSAPAPASSSTLSSGSAA